MTDVPAELVLTDALTPTDHETLRPDGYIVDAENVPYLVTTVLGLALEEPIKKWSGCWCGPQLAYDHDPRVQNCPTHGDDWHQHLASAMLVELRALAGKPEPTEDAADPKEPPF